MERTAKFVKHIASSVLEGSQLLGSACRIKGSKPTVKTMGSETEKSTAPEQSLGEYLRNLRVARKLSLRDVEEASGVSNAYLSQLEQGKITKPSPHFLHKLAGCYVVPYEKLMEKAGYISREEPGSKTSTKPRRGQLAPSSLGTLTRAEEEELLKYLGYIRSQQKK